MATYNLRPLVFQQVVVTSPADTFIVNPLDNNGNVIPEIIIEVDSSLGIATIELPSIYALNNDFNINIKILGVTAGTNDVAIKANAFDGNYIGSATSVSLTTNGESIICSPINSTIWTGLITG